jgi:hypothetical protein
MMRSVNYRYTNATVVTVHISVFVLNRYHVCNVQIEALAQARWSTRGRQVQLLELVYCKCMQCQAHIRYQIVTHVCNTPSQCIAALPAHRHQYLMIVM